MENEKHVTLLYEPPQNTAERSCQAEIIDFTASSCLSSTAVGVGMDQVIKYVVLFEIHHAEASVINP